MAYRPDGTQLATGGAGGTVRVWDADSGAKIHSISGHKDRVLGVAYRPDGTQLASAGRDGTVRIWDADTGAEVRSISGHNGWVWGVAYRPDGTQLASAIQRGRIRVWDAVSGAEVRSISGDNQEVWGVAYRPDGTQLASAGRGGTVRVLDAVSGAEVLTLSGHKGTVWGVAYRPDGTQLASAGEDGTFRVWDANTGEMLAVEARSGITFAVAWNPKNQDEVATGHNEEVVLWSHPHFHHTDSVAVLHNDEVGGAEAIDALGLGNTAETMARWMMASEVKPPLAVGLFGPWGGGKSFFLNMLRRRVDALTEVTGTVANVRQVDFNAWHYSDAQLWASLAQRLFSELRPPVGDESTHGDDRPHQLERKRSELACAEAEFVAYNRATYRTDDGATLGDLAEKSGPDKAVFLAEMGLSDASIETVMGMRRGLTWQVGSWRSMLVKRWREFLMLTLLYATFAYPAYLAAKQAWTFGAWVLGTLAALPVVIGLTAAIKAACHAGEGAKWLSETVKGLADESMKREQEQQDRLGKRVSELRTRVTELEAAAPEMEWNTLMAARSGTEGYRKHLGVIHEVQGDLKRMADLLKRAHKEKANVAQDRDDRLSDLRIILYIDDLDRCSPERVVQVLEAVKLLVSNELFLVVVAVDPRWLHASINLHFNRLIAGTGDGPNLATSHDYLEKIFQIPLLLPDMDEDGHRSVVRDLTAGIIEDSTGSNQHEGSRTSRSESPSVVDARESSEGRNTTPAIEPVGPAIDTGEPRGPGASGDPAVSVQQVVQLAPPELASLRLTQDEADWIAAAGPLISTPRASKRLVNTYLLFRASQPAEDVYQVVRSGDAQAAVVLLGALAGFPALAEDLVDRIKDTNAEPSADLMRWLEKADKRYGLSDLLKPLGEAIAQVGASQNLAAYQKVLVDCRRFSFGRAPILAPTYLKPPIPEVTGAADFG